MNGKKTNSFIFIFSFLKHGLGYFNFNFDTKYEQLISYNLMVDIKSQYNIL